jgi:hypothetical protein
MTMMKSLLVTVGGLLLGTGSALAQGVCGPGNPLDRICEEQSAMRESLTDLGSDVAGLEASITSTATDLSELDVRVSALQASLNALSAVASRLESAVSSLAARVGSVAEAVARVEANLDAHRAAAHKFWISPAWEVLEGASTTRVTALNLGSVEVEVVFTFFDRDGRINSTFSTSRLLPAGASITILLDDRGIDPPQHGWFAVTASGPVQVEGYSDFGRGDRALTREYARRTLRFEAVDCRRDPATWPTTRAPYLCDFIDRELTRLW